MKIVGTKENQKEWNSKLVGIVIVMKSHLGVKK